MGYTSDHDLQDLFDPDPLRRHLFRAAARIVQELRDEAARRTPVARRPAAAPPQEWLASRHGRVPGTLREAWDSTPVVEAGERFSGEVFNPDPVAPHVEWDTAPHIIRPKHREYLRYWDDVARYFRKEVHHPGTTGQHMLRDAMTEIEVRQTRILEEEAAAWAAEYR